LRRQKWIILLVVLGVTSSALVLSVRQAPLYEASADVLLRHQNLAASLTGIQDLSGVYEDATRILETQTKIALSPEVAKRTLAAAHVTDMTPDQFLASVRVTTEPNADVLQFAYTDRNPARAVLLATEHARQFIEHRKRLDTQALAFARREAQQRIEQLKADGFEGSSLYDRLVGSEQQLRTMEALQTANASLLRAANRAIQVQPQPVRNGMLGFTLGLLLGVGLAFLREALDTRVRSAAEVGDRLGLPLLARLPEPPRELRGGRRLVMRARPQGVHAEAFRMLRTNLEFANLERGARTIMVTSAIGGEGKTTTVANLGVALGRAGRRVMLVDLDLRRPTLSEFFELGQQPGLTDVALGYAALEDAIAPVALSEAPENGATKENGRGSITSLLEVLPSGPLPPDPGEFVNTHALRELLEQVRERVELVLIDAPPLLSVGDAMALSPRVDALMVVTRLSLIRRPTLAELRRVLDHCPTSKLGFVLTAAELEEGYGYGYGEYSYRYPDKSVGRERDRVA
jgi:capsular exopolysaccharide synthesis family protein